MKNQIKRLSLLALALMAAVATFTECSSDDAKFYVPDNSVLEDQIVDPNSSGYLKIGGLDLVVNFENENHTDNERGDYEAVALAGRAEEGVSTDDYIVWITSSNGDEVYRDSYANAKLLTEPLKLKADVYTVWAASAASVEATSDAPYYASTGSEEYVVSDEREVETGKITCRMANIKVSVSMSADMFALFDNTSDIVVTLTYGDAEIKFTNEEIGSKVAYFATNKEVNSIDVELVGMYNTGTEYSKIAWTKRVEQVIAGQARVISIAIDNYAEGKLYCNLKVENWVVENTLGVDVMSKSIAMYKAVENGIADPDSMVTDKFSPDFSLEIAGSEYDLTQQYIFASSMLDEDLQSYKNPIVGYFTPYEGTSVESVSMKITTTNAELEAKLAEAGYVDNTIPLWSDGAANAQMANYMTIREDGEKVKFAMLYGGMVELDKYSGEYEMQFIAIGSNNMRSFNTFLLRAYSDVGPQIEWMDGADGTVYDFATRYRIYRDSDLPDGVTNPAIAIKLTSGTGITGLTVSMGGEVLTEAALGALNLAPSMDLINPATPEMAGMLADLGFKLGDEVLGKTDLIIDISSFMPMLAMLPVDGKQPGDSINTYFTIGLTDVSGSVEQTILVYSTQTK